jgi:Peptidase inhibitor I78 family
MKHLLALALVPALAACGLDPAPDPAPPAEDCGLAGALPLIGQPESVLAAMTFPIGTRIFRTGDALTMDYSPTRLNIEIGANGVIATVTCG